MKKFSFLVFILIIFSTLSSGTALYASENVNMSAKDPYLEGSYTATSGSDIPYEVDTLKELDSGTLDEGALTVKITASSNNGQKATIKIKVTADPTLITATKLFSYLPTTNLEMAQISVFSGGKIASS